MFNLKMFKMIIIFVNIIENYICILIPLFNTEKQFLNYFKSIYKYLLFLLTNIENKYSSYSAIRSNK